MNDEKPRAMTVDEAKEAFLIQMWHMVNYWDTVTFLECHKDGRSAQRHRLEGLLHSILADLDGCSLGVPAMEIRPLVPPDDVKFHKEQGENWFPNKTDIGGSLHELMYPVGRKNKLTT